jgi:hypothetical protein
MYVICAEGLESVFPKNPARFQRERRIKVDEVTHSHIFQRAAEVAIEQLRLLEKRRAESEVGPCKVRTGSGPYRHIEFAPLVQAVDPIEAVPVEINKPHNPSFNIQPIGPLISPPVIRVRIALYSAQAIIKAVWIVANESIYLNKVGVVVTKNCFRGSKLKEQTG